MPDQPQPKRRWLQISLRTLLVVVTVLCVWLGMQANAARKQHTAVAKVRSLGGGVGYDYQLDEKGNWKTNPSPWAPKWLRNVIGDDYFCSPVIVNLDGPSRQTKGAANANDDDLACVSDFPKLWELTLSDSRITDDGLRHLATLNNLEVLTLGGTKIIGSGLRHLSGLSKLRVLDLRNAAITDESLASIGRLPNLTNLLLTDSAITDAGLSNLVNLKSLEILDLRGTKISDSGLPQLSELPKLKLLLLVATAVTHEGASKLKQALPNCNVKD